MHLKMQSVYVVCWIFLQTFQTYFCIQANSVDPDQTAPVCKNDFKNHKMTKQKTIVEICSYRVLTALCIFIDSVEEKKTTGIQMRGQF